jgi:amino acid adenylation domain-containing protein
MLLEPCPEMIIGILAILKAGGAYLPIDPTYPENRINYMLTDSNTGVLLSKVSKVSRNIEIIDLTHLASPTPPTHLTHLTHPTHLCYVIYTSGTTGKPKGAMIEHGNVVRLMFHDNYLFDFNSRDVWTMFHSYCFDFSVWEMYGALLYGGKLVLIPRMTARDPGRFLEILKKENVTVLNQTPPAFYNLVREEGDSPGKKLKLRYVIFGGEALKPAKLEQWREKYPGTKLINMYGITETTVHVTYKEIETADIKTGISNIGSPIPTLGAYVMDRKQKLVPIGAAGELYVGGKGVARGYLNRPALTGEKFVENPYSPGERLYRSGDLVRLDEHGDMEYLGRIDHQVQVRGFRVELGEIETCLLKHRDISETTVIAREEKNGNWYICAYVTPGNNGNELTVTGLREYLQREMPDYMVPSYFVKVDKIPLTSNGKVDRKALPEPTAKTGEEYLPPGNEIEETLARIWQNVLLLEKVGIRDNYFNLGGDSIKAIKLLNSVNETFHTNLEIVDLFTHETIEKLANCINRAGTSLLSRELEDVSNEIAALREKILSQMNKHGYQYGDIEDIYPMSDIEKGMVFHSLRESGLAVYHDQMVHQLKYPGFDPARFKKAFALMVEKHPVLRTAFNITDFGEPVQIVHKTCPINVEHVDILHLQRAGQEEYIRQAVAADRQEPFHVSAPPLWRMKTFALDADHIVVLWVCHHAILDGWSDASFNTELNNIYLALKTEPGFVPEKLKSSYKEFILEQMAWKRKETLREYWKNELADFKRLEFPVTGEPGEAPTDVRRLRNVKNYLYDLGGSFLERLTHAAARHNTRVKHLCFAAYMYMLNMLSYESDIAAGLITNNRPLCEDGEKILGCFLNSVPVRVKIPAGIKWSDYIRLIDEKLIELTKYDRLPFLEIVRLLGQEAQDRNPVFDTIFTFVDFHVYGALTGEQNQEADNKLSVEGKVSTNTLFDFTIDTTLERLTVSINYSDSFISQKIVEKCCLYFENILARFMDGDEDSFIQKDEFFLPEERQKLLHKFNNTGRDTAYPKDKTIHELCEEQAARTPDGTAIYMNHRTYITYDLLNKKSNQLARLLRKKDVSPDTIVGLMLEPSIDMIIAILTVLKAGGAYLPIDPAYPEERNRFILKDSSTDILLTTRELAGKIEFEKENIYLEEWQRNGPDANLTGTSRPGNLAYVIYTSGTTGKPKGSLIRHWNVVGLMFHDNYLFEFGPRDVWTMFHSYCFDFSVWEMYGALLYGGKLVLVPRMTARDPQQCLELFKKHHVTVLNQTPSAFYSLINQELKHQNRDLRYLRYVIFGGEALKPIKLREWKKKYPHTRLINMLGITETTVHVTFKEISHGEIQSNISNIGSPLPPLTAYLFDASLKLVPIGVPGELCVGGTGVARGYLNKPGLTREKFSENPFKKGEKLYRSGDLARLSGDGEMEYLGRIDHQVKIRGYRIELAEIETRLLIHPDITDALVIIKEAQNKDKYLCAYIVSGRELTISEVREFLSKSLPDYMLPSYLVRLDCLPLTPSGKVDKKALPHPEINIGKEYTAPGDRVEQKLVEIWSDVFGVKKNLISIDAGFFELGGHSLNAVMLMAGINKELGVKVPLAELFVSSTVRSMAEYIKHLTAEKVEAVEPAEMKEYYELSSSQKRLYVVQQMDLENTSYNVPRAVILRGPIEKETIESTFGQLITRHENLRTAFITVKERPVQVVYKQVDFSIEYYQARQEEVDALVKRFVRPFDLGKAPLLRVTLVTVQPSYHVLLYDLHHIVTDGISQEILIRDFLYLYSGAELPGTRLHYKDFAEWQNQWAASGKLKQQEDYWLKVFKDGCPILKLATDYPRPGVMDIAKGDTVHFEIGPPLAQRLLLAVENSQTTLYMFLLAVYNVLLAKYSGQEDIVVGTPVTGRSHPDLQDVIGLFLNMAAVRNFPARDKTFKEFLAEVKENALGAYKNQDYPFDQLIVRLGLQGSASRNPLFDVELAVNAYTRIEDANIETPGIEIEPYHSEVKFAKFDLHFAVDELEDRIKVAVRYSTQLFQEASIEKMCTIFVNILEQVMENPGIKLKDIVIPHDYTVANLNIYKDDEDEFEL